MVELLFGWLFIFSQITSPCYCKASKRSILLCISSPKISRTPCHYPICIATRFASKCVMRMRMPVCHVGYGCTIQTNNIKFQFVANRFSLQLYTIICLIPVNSFDGTKTLYRYINYSNILIKFNETISQLQLFQCKPFLRITSPGANVLYCYLVQFIDTQSFQQGENYFKCISLLKTMLKQHHA